MPLDFHLPVSKEMFPLLSRTHLHQLQSPSGSMEGTIRAAKKYQLRSVGRHYFHPLVCTQMTLLQFNWFICICSQLLYALCKLQKRAGLF